MRVCWSSAFGAGLGRSFGQDFGPCNYEQSRYSASFRISSLTFLFTLFDQSACIILVVDRMKRLNTARWHHTAIQYSKANKTRKRLEESARQFMEKKECRG